MSGFATYSPKIEHYNLSFIRIDDSRSRLETQTPKATDFFVPFRMPRIVYIHTRHPNELASRGRKMPEQSDSPLHTV